MNEQIINIGECQYKYYLSNNLNALAQKILDYKANKYFFIYDKNIDSKIINCLKSEISEYCENYFIEFESSENKKNLLTIDELSNILLGHNFNRQSCLVAVGGGVLGNIVGLIASTLFRGVKLIHIPTTIIGAADSTISLKQAVNTKYGKNLIGTFYAPLAVFTDFNMFESLSDREYISGIAELIKNMIITIPEEIPNFEMEFKKGIKRNYSEFKFILEKSIKAKIKLLSNDKYEKEKGLALEYGHTAGHALEFLSKSEIRHGEAVAFGMLVAAEISYARNQLSNEELTKHYDLIDMIGLSKQLYIIKKYNIQDILTIMKFDNKRGYLDDEKDDNKINMVIMNKIGEVGETSGKLLKRIDEKEIFNALLKTYDKLTSDILVKL